jgi:hypothetical protein
MPLFRGRLLMDQDVPYFEKNQGKNYKKHNLKIAKMVNKLVTFYITNVLKNLAF